MMPCIKIHGDRILVLTMAIIFSLFLPTHVTANESENVTYYLTTPNDITTVSLTHNIDKMDPHVMTHFILHGWKSNANATDYIKMATALDQLSPSNVIRVDYSPVANLSYTKAYVELPKVGKIFAKFIIGLIQKHNFNLSLIHIIGHSLGAQVTGDSCRDVHAALKVKVGWATGLDAARIGYESLILPAAIRLTRKDAFFVDMIHTDGGGFGYKRAAGHIDFFVNENGQRLQPGCMATKSADTSSFLVAVIDGKPDDGGCSHARSNIFYIESINTRALATKCNSYNKYKRGRCDHKEKIVFGVTTPQNTTGNFYFRTRDSSPYLIPSQ